MTHLHLTFMVVLIGGQLGTIAWDCCRCSSTCSDTLSEAAAQMQSVTRGLDHSNLGATLQNVRQHVLRDYHDCKGTGCNM